MGDHLVTAGTLSNQKSVWQTKKSFVEKQVTPKAPPHITE